MTTAVRATTANRHEQAVLNVLIYCEDHLDEQLDLEALAAIAGFSPFHFHRVFHRVTGESPKECLRRLRLEKAVHRLKVSPDSLLQIALQSGFSTPETFSRAFTRQFGINPSEFRNVLREYRRNAYEIMGCHQFSGFTDDTPLTMRFNMEKEPMTVERTPPRHLLFVRHVGYEHLLADGRSFLSLWDDLLAFADRHEIRYTPERLVGLTHDDPYVTDERHIRFDACLQVPTRMAVDYPIGYRYQEAALCVARRHVGGLEEIARTFAYIGVEWLPSDNYGLQAGIPFEIYSSARGPDGVRARTHTDAYVPLALTTPTPQGAR